MDMANKEHPVLEQLLKYAEFYRDLASSVMS